jgi:hypothetical protein
LYMLDVPLSFSFGVSDVTNNTATGSSFNISAGYSIKF